LFFVDREGGRRKERVGWKQYSYSLEREEGRVMVDQDDILHHSFCWELMMIKLLFATEVGRDVMYRAHQDHTRPCQTRRTRSGMGLVGVDGIT
jgi:hypothetical protein